MIYIKKIELLIVWTLEKNILHSQMLCVTEYSKTLFCSYAFRIISSGLASTMRKLLLHVGCVIFLHKAVNVSLYP